MKIKLTLLQRMTLTAMMLAISIITTRFVGVYVTPYVRLSLGISIVIFSSILLGPISGAIICSVGDILGILMVPAGVDLNPFYTISCVFMGATPGLFMMLFNKFKDKENKGFIIFNSLLLLIWILLTIFCSLTNAINIFKRELTINLIGKILIPIIAFVLMVGVSMFLFFFNKHFKKKIENDNRLPSPYQIGFIVVFIEVFFTLLLNTLIKSLFYSIDFSVIFFPALLLAFIYIPLNTIVVSYLCLLSSKVIKER